MEFFNKARPKLVATIQKSGTWYATSFFWSYNHLLGERASHRMPWHKVSTPGDTPRLQQRALAETIRGFKLRDKQVLTRVGCKPLYVCHVVCPGYLESADPYMEQWKSLSFYTDGYNYGETLMGNDSRHLNPFRDKRARIVYLYRNPLDHFVSFWEHVLRHTDERHRMRRAIDGTIVPITDLRDFIYNGSALDSYVKHFRTFWYMHDRFPEQLRLIPYEELVRAPAMAFGSMLEHFGSPVTTETEKECFSHALRSCSRESMQEIESEIGRALTGDQSGRHVRDGRVAQWKEHLDCEDVFQIEARLNEFGISLDQFITE